MGDQLKTATSEKRFLLFVGNSPIKTIQSIGVGSDFHQAPFSLGDVMSLKCVVGLFVCVVALLAVGPIVLGQESPSAPTTVSPVKSSINDVLQAEAETVEAQKDAGPKDEVADELRQRLLGAWLMAPKQGQDKTDDPRIEVQQKFFGLGHWIYTLSDPKTGELVGSHGGTYTLNGDVYEETIVFAAFSTEEMIGNSYKFKLTVKGDRLTQRGVGNNFNEDYTRLQASAAKPQE